MPEFDLIRRLQQIIEQPAAPGRPECLVGIGDDAAVLRPPSDRDLAVCTDTLVENVHFSSNDDPRAIGHKALAVNLSDLAAMGAEPAWFFLALTLPGDDDEWCDAFAHGMAGLAASTGTVLAGGDTTRGRLTVTVTAIGTLPRGRALTRAGARPGDRVFVSGVPGRAGFALAERAAGREPPADCARSLDFPEPRLALGAALLEHASACIDISDGLAADLGHVLEASGVSATLRLERLPIADSLSGLGDEERWPFQLAGGDDYELCFTVPAERSQEVVQLARERNIEITEIGEIGAGRGLVLSRPDGSVLELARTGFEHFGTGSGEAS